MTNSLQLNLLQYQDKLVLKKEDGKVKVFDPIRNRFMVKGPEEVVRQLTIQYLIDRKNYNKNRIAVEKMLTINGLLKRFDILVYDRNTEPFLLVECKAPNVPISEDTFRQIAVYNMVLKVRYLLVTNGVDSFCCRMDYEQQSFEFINEVPSFAERN